MSHYKAPLDDMRFILNEVLSISEMSSFPGYDGLDDETINQILSEGAKFNEGVLAPLNQTGDREGCTYDSETGDVKTPTGFKEAYDAFTDNMWGALNCDPEYGGMGMPNALSSAFVEMICSSNMSFGMYPGLSHGVYNAVHEYGSDEIKDTYLPKLVDGTWTGTMCLTEPHAGTDLGLISTKAVPQDDGSYNITGEKIFISSGEHDLTENICHLVLARIDDKDLPEDDKTPEGIKGISLFIVPKFMPDDQGNVTEDRNDVRCGGIEEKMGIHGNSTCSMQFDGAKAMLVGEKHKGMRAMFVMMNEARQNVGVQGLGLMEASYQNAVEYASERLQGPDITKKGAKGPDAIINHPGVRRDLMEMKAMSEGGRMLAYWTGMLVDYVHKHPEEEERKHAKDLLDLMTPVVKGHLTDGAYEMTNRGMQVLGGHGYIEESGMAQYARDARITQIYEGTNGIQALDLIGRKVMIQGLMSSYLKEVDKDISASSSEFNKPLKEAVKVLKSTTRSLKMQAALKGKNKEAQNEIMAAAADDYAKMVGRVVLGHMWLKMADAAQSQLDAGAPQKDFYETKLNTARFYFEKVLPEVHTLKATIKSGPKSLTAIASEHFVHDQTTVGEKSIPSVAAAKNKAKSWIKKWF